jgi:hypothetical protein
MMGCFISSNYWHRETNTVGSLTRKEAPDRGKINIHDPAVAKWWSHELDVSREQLCGLIDKVGNSAATVMKELDREKGNGRT